MPFSTAARTPVRVIAVAATVAALTASGSLSAPIAVADSPVAPRSGQVTVTGAGFGHGIGMSQYGAYGAAVRGRTYQQILAFYYPGTRLAAAPRSTMRVWVTADSDSDTRVSAAAGLTVSDAAGKRVKLPTGSAYRSWRISRSGSGYKLSYRSGSGSWKTRSTGLGSSTWTFSATGNVLRLQLPGGTRELRGRLSLIKRGSGGRTVNTVSLEDYVRGVVPAEMPTSWHAQAVRVQAVAARTYAARLQSRATSAGYDICDTTACQVYRGKGVETANGNAAVAATKGKILWYRNDIALAMFSSSNGGRSISGGLPYLRAGADPYDGVIKSQSWKRTISASRIAGRWSVGTLRSVRVTARTGGGSWGGYITKITITGSKRSVSISGNTFKYAYGLRSTYFTFGGTAVRVPPSPVITPPAVTNKPGRAYASFPRSYYSGSRVDLTMIATDGSLRRYPVAGGRLGTPSTIGRGFAAYTHVVNVGDWNGDGFQDTVARTSRGRLLLFRGTRTGQLAAGVDMGVATRYRSLSSVGDLDGDRFPDLVALDTSGRAYLLQGNGRTGFRSSRQLPGAWSAHSAIRGVGDLDRDGRLDLVSQVGNRLFLHRGAGSGFRAATALAPSVAGLSAVTAVGDVSGDGKVDVLGRTSGGALRLFRGDGKGQLAAGVTLAGSYRGLRFAS